MIKFNPTLGLAGDNYARNMRTLQIVYNTGGEDMVYDYSFPLDILDDIGPAELSRRIYSVFKQHITRKRLGQLD